MTAIRPAGIETRLAERYMEALGKMRIGNHEFAVPTGARASGGLPVIQSKSYFKWEIKQVTDGHVTAWKGTEARSVPHAEFLAAQAQLFRGLVRGRMKEKGEREDAAIRALGALHPPLAAMFEIKVRRDTGT